MTLGASDRMSRFDCRLVEDGLGGFTLKLIPKFPVPEAIGVPFAAETSFESSFSISNDSVDNEFTRNEPLWRDRRRGDSI